MDRKQGSQQQNSVRIALTDEQQKQIQQATGNNAKAIELSAQELEERISPALKFTGK